MAFVNSVVCAEARIESHSLTVVKQSIVGLKQSPHRTLFLGGTDGQMTMEFVENKGYYISAFGRNEVEEWLACDESLPREQVRVKIAGQVAELPRRVLVSEEIALEVASGFYRDGTRISSHSWIRTLDLM